jgi:hypothetical protein
LYPTVLIVLSFLTSTKTVPIRKVTFAGPIWTGGVGVAADSGICIEFCAPLEIGKIKPPPAKVPANKNWRRVRHVSSLFFIGPRSWWEEPWEAIDPATSRSAAFAGSFR